MTYAILSIIMMTLATIADYWTTDYALYRGMTEGNPIVRAQMKIADRLGVHWFDVNGVATAIVSVVLLALGWQALMIAAVGRAGVAGWNLYQIWKHENK